MEQDCDAILSKLTGPKGCLAAFTAFMSGATDGMKKLELHAQSPIVLEQLRKQQAEIDAIRAKCDKCMSDQVVKVENEILSASIGTAEAINKANEHMKAMQFKQTRLRQADRKA